jgi:hypothetical protein
MARKRHSQRGPPRTPAGDGQRREGSHRLSRQSAIWLGTLSTVVGLATGMFTLRDQVFPRESGNARASLPAYQQAVGDICAELNKAERARARDARGMARRLRRAGTVIMQRNVLLDSARRGLARSSHQLALFEGLDVPGGLAERHRSTAAAWNRNAERIRGYTDRLDAAGSRRELLAAVAVLHSIRRPLARDGVTLDAGLENLGGGRCRLDPPIVTPTITLPRAAQDVSPPKPTAPGRAPSGPTPTAPSGTGPGTGPGPTPSAAAAGVETPSPAPASPVVTPPSPTGGGAVPGGSSGDGG